MGGNISYELLQPSETREAIDMVMSTFNDSVAEFFSNKGTYTFREYAGNMADRLGDTSFVVVARQDGCVIGVIEIRDDTHIALFFVDRSRQKSGVGRRLLEEAVTTMKRRGHPPAMTVNSSPNSVEAYRSMGFIADGPEQTTDGIRFTPMTKPLK